MKQEIAIEKIYKSLKKDKAILAIFLKGAHASGQEDEYSDIDMYCLVDPEKINEYLERRLSHLKKYMPLIYYSESNFVGPQIVAVFEDGLHFDLYTVTESNLQQTDNIKVLHDPLGKLNNYRAKSFILTDKEIVRSFNEVTFILLEFETAFKRGDLVWASRLASHMIGNISTILRQLHQPEKAKLGLKKLNTVLNNKDYQKLKEITEMISPSQLPKGILELCDLWEELLSLVSSEIKQKTNTKFFTMMKERCLKL